MDGQKWFSTGKVGPYLQELCVRLYGTTRKFKNPAETRFAGKLIQLKQFFNMKLAMQQCVGSQKYKRYNFEDDVFADAIEDDDCWDLVSRILKCVGPLLLIVRLGDLKQATLSKLRGTTDYVKTLMVVTGDDSLEDKVAKIYHDMVPQLESDVANCAYCIDPQFVHKSRDAPRDVMDSFWSVSRKIIGHSLTDTEWLPIRARLARELQAFRMKSGGFAFEDYSMDETCVFWGVAGCHAPTLKIVAYALAPLPCSSSEAERNWFEVKSNKTKVRNRLGSDVIQKTIFVRRFLRLEDRLLDENNLVDPVYKHWVKVLLRDAASSDNDNSDAADGGNDDDDIMSLTVFTDEIEADEQRKINGRDNDGKRVMSLGKLRKDKTARSWLFEKYFNMCFVDKNPEEDDPDAPPLADPSKWEHRQIQNVVWSRRQGHVVETVIIDDDDDDESESYVIDEILMQMIRGSPHNTRQIKSKVIKTNSRVVDQSPVTSQLSSDSDSDTAAPASAQIENV